MRHWRVRLHDANPMMQRLKMCAFIVFGIDSFVESITIHVSCELRRAAYVRYVREDPTRSQSDAEKLAPRVRACLGPVVVDPRADTIRGKELVPVLNVTDRHDRQCAAADG